MITSEHSSEPVTPEAVAAKMKQLDVTGMSSMAPVPLELQMSCLEEIERILTARQAANAA